MQSFEIWLDQRDMEIEAKERSGSSTVSLTKKSNKAALLATISTGVDDGLQAAMAKRKG